MHVSASCARSLVREGTGMADEGEGGLTLGAMMLSLKKMISLEGEA